MPVASVPGVRLHYERVGTGEPLLWISGFGISSRVFSAVLPHYTDRFDCVTFDNRCSGRSSVPWWPTSIPAMAADAVALLDALEIQSAHVYGLSMGGMVAQEMALRFPNRVRAVVLGATTPGGPDAPPPSLTAVMGIMGLLGGRRWSREDLLARLLFSPGFLQRRPRSARHCLSLLAEDQPTTWGLASQSLASAVHDTSTRLGSIRAPVLVLHGAADRLVSSAAARVLADRIPDATMVLLAEAGHLYLLEQPVAARDALVGWLDERGEALPSAPATGLDGWLEPITRRLALQLGGARAACTGAVVTSRRLTAAAQRPLAG